MISEVTRKQKINDGKETGSKRGKVLLLVSIDTRFGRLATVANPRALVRQAQLHVEQFFQPNLVGQRRGRPVFVPVGHTRSCRRPSAMAIAQKLLHFVDEFQTEPRPLKKVFSLLALLLGRDGSWRFLER
jgi:hypothetical protein